MECEWLSVSAFTHPGKNPNKQIQEDSLGYVKLPSNHVMYATKGDLYVLADGVGSCDDGALSSTLAVQIILEFYYKNPTLDVEEALETAIQTANQHLWQARQQKLPQDLQTTVVCVLIHQQTVYFAHVGDSQAYLIRDKKVVERTKDHSYGQNLITRSLGSERKVLVDMNRYPLQVDDIILLCSDGLSRMISTQTILQHLFPPIEEERVAPFSTVYFPQQWVKTLTKAANDAGGEDNISELIIWVKKLPHLQTGKSIARPDIKRYFERKFLAIPSHPPPYLPKVKTHYRVRWLILLISIYSVLLWLILWLKIE